MSPRIASPIAQVAARAGVSIATVSRVVNGVPNKASAATVARVRAAVAELGYRPTSAGRALRERRSRLVAVLAPNLANPAMAAIAASIEAQLRPAGLVMIACDTHDDAEIQDEYLAAMQAERVRATILLGAVPSPRLATAEGLVFVNRRHPGGAAPFIGIDNLTAGADAAGFFLDRGLPVLGILHGAATSSATAERIAGFRRRIALPGEAVITLPGLEHAEIGYRATPALLRARRGPAGIFCSSDLIAFGAHRAVLERGLRVPEDVTLLGFDDSPLNDWLAPWLSSIRVPYADFGAACAAAIAARDGGQAVTDRILPHRLVVRAVAGPR